MIVVIIKTVVLTLCILAVLLMFFARKYDFCIWKKGKFKIKERYISDYVYVYDKFMCLVDKNNYRSRIEIDFENNTIRIETKGSSELLTYTFSKYKVIDDDETINKIEFMFEDEYEIESATLTFIAFSKHLNHLKIQTKNCDKVIEYSNQYKV